MNGEAFLLFLYIERQHICIKETRTIKSTWQLHFHYGCTSLRIMN